MQEFNEYKQQLAAAIATNDDHALVDLLRSNSHRTAAVTGFRRVNHVGQHYLTVFRTHFPEHADMNDDEFLIWLKEQPKIRLQDANTNTHIPTATRSMVYKCC